MIPALLLLVLLFLAPAAEAAPDRVAAWREDLDTLVTGFLPRDLSFSPGARREFVGAIGRLRTQVPDLTDDQIVVEMLRAVALAGNAHTRLYVLRNRTRLSRLPIRVYRFEDGLFVLRADSAHRELLGARVDSIEGRSVAEVERRVAPLFSGNDAWREYMATYLVTCPQILRGVGVLSNGSNSPRFSFHLRAGGAGSARLTAGPLQRVEAPTEAWWDLSPLHPGRFGPWLTALPPDSTALPRYLKYPTRYYWFERLARQDAVYFQFNRAQNDPEAETIAAFGRRLLAEVTAHPPGKLIVDLRFNTGGDLTLADSLFHAIAALPLARRRDALFVITSRSTFSAGISHVVTLKQITGARIVGEPAGDVLDFWSEGGSVVLPNCGIPAHYADGFHSYSLNPIPPGVTPALDLGVDSIAPDLPAPLRSRDYFGGRDPSMERILSYHPAR